MRRRARRPTRAVTVSPWSRSATENQPLDRLHIWRKPRTAERTLRATTRCLLTYFGSQHEPAKSTVVRPVGPLCGHSGLWSVEWHEPLGFGRRHRLRGRRGEPDSRRWHGGKSAAGTAGTGGGLTGFGGNAGSSSAGTGGTGTIGTGGAGTTGTGGSVGTGGTGGPGSGGSAATGGAGGSSSSGDRVGRSARAAR